MTNRERMRLYMARQRQVRRAKGLCPRCGLVTVPRGTNCAECNDVRRGKRLRPDERLYICNTRGGFPLDTRLSTRAS